ncbi:hypothetical protein ACIGO9_30550 [Nocardia asteroides]|uniref:hypothetical protein n=1 Tax=Nocardia asteroides TaxID=1824 RepID=UPI0037CB85B3
MAQNVFDGGNLVEPSPTGSPKPPRISPGSWANVTLMGPAGEVLTPLAHAMLR